MYSSSQYIFTFIYVCIGVKNYYLQIQYNIVPKVVIQITLHRIKVVKNSPESWTWLWLWQRGIVQ